MEGIITNYRMGRETQTPKHMIIEVPDVSTREEAEKLAGKKVEWETPSGKKMHGEVAGAHGNNGRIRAIFEKGLPGQSLGTRVKLK